MLRNSPLCLRAALVLAALLFAVPAQAGHDIEWVDIGDVGNNADTGGYGVVGYPYRISKYEITNAQFSEFLNAVAPSSEVGFLHLYSSTSPTARPNAIERFGTPGSFTYTPMAGTEDWPAGHVSYWGAAAYANWLQNGQPTCDRTCVHNGAYDGIVPGVTIVTDHPRKPEAKFFVPTDDEWYKAAYYAGGGTNAGYWDYPTSTNTAPTCSLPGAGPNLVNCDRVVDEPTPVGSYTGSISPSGTFDQGGNVFEWTETQSTNLVYNVIIRGGHFINTGLITTSAAYRRSLDSRTFDQFYGFRIASLPPATCGDGLVTGAETCDDGGTTSGDGCTFYCQVETGYSCVGEPSICSAGCGDGLILGAEACDDSNTTPGDGCSDICEVEPPWICNGQPSVCGIPNTTVPTELSTGDEYRLVFVTSGTRNASSTDIADYNAFVTASANTIPALASLGATWSAIGSTSTLDARDNTGTNFNVETGVPIYLLDNRKFAYNNNDLWNGGFQNLKLNVTEDSQMSTDPFVWTGTAFSGVEAVFFVPIGLGNATSRTGDATANTSASWVSSNNTVNTGQSYPLYAMSDVLKAGVTITGPGLVLIDGGSGDPGGVDVTIGTTNGGTLVVQSIVAPAVDVPIIIGGDPGDITFGIATDPAQLWEITYTEEPLLADVTLTFGYDDTGLTEAEELGLAIWQYVDAVPGCVPRFDCEWLQLSSTIDTVLNTVTVVTSSLSLFVLGIASGPCVTPEEELYITTITIDGNGKPVLHYQDPVPPPSEVTGYNVYRAGAPTGPWVLLGSNVVDMDEATADIQYVDQTGDVGGPWYYEIAAWNEACGAEGPY